MQPVLFLGATGKLGRGLQAFWRLHPSKKFAPHWCAREGVDGFANQVRAVVALWGVTEGSAAELAANTALARRAGAIGLRLGAARVLHLSSAAVYTPSRSDLRETDPTEPSRAYGQAKYAMEAALAQMPEPPQHCALRLANVAGSDSLFRALTQDAPITIDRFASGQGPQRSYIAIPELARTIEGLISCDLSDLPSVLNVAAPEPVRMEALVQAAGRKFEWRTAPDSAVERYALDTTGLQRLIDLPAHASDPAHLVESWRHYGGWA